MPRQASQGIEFAGFQPAPRNRGSPSPENPRHIGGKSPGGVLCMG